MAQELLIRSYLKQLKLPAITQSYTKLAREAAEANMPYEGYLLALLAGVGGGTSDRECDKEAHC